jgi:predicted CXXCH cytochrome family protein
MSKIKLSFSFLLTLVLVGMFSVVAFAAPPSSPSITFAEWKNGELHFAWTAPSGATSYTVYIDGATTGITTTNNNYIVTPTPANNVDHTIQVTASNATAETSAKSTIVTVTPTIAHNPADTMEKSQGVGDNGLNNAHNTGVGTINKNPDTQLNNKGVSGAHKLHGSYQNNTNSCASCHQTHTAASGGLLFKNGAYNTCTACHDGTLGFYNVFGTENKDDMGAGTFGGTHDGNMSAHMSTGALEISAAPGSNAKVGTNWTAEFTCASCHDPHGSYSDRLLAVNPNGMSTVMRTSIDANGTKYTKTSDILETDGKTLKAGVTLNGTVYGNKLMDIQVVTTLPSNTVTPIKAEYLNDYVFLQYDITPADVASGGWYENTGLKADRDIAGVPTPDRILQLYRYIGGAWEKAPGTFLTKTGVKNTANWPKLYALAGDTTAITVNEAKATAGDFWFNNSKAFYKIPTTQAVAKVSDVQKAYVVEFGYFAGNKNKLGSNIPTAANGYQPKATDNSFLTTAGKGIKMNEWCGSCHVDYFTRTKTNTGVDGNYTHHTMSDSYNCERCHYAHGTDAKIMRDAQGNTLEDLTAPTGKFVGDQAKAIDYLKDVNQSSALKRFTNMAVCYGCHTSSHAEGFINNNDYNYKDSNQGFQSGSVTKGAKLMPPWAQ